ncbi:MAG: tetratricopeptide repeat protein [Minicystis sp.]
MPSFPGMTSTCGNNWPKTGTEGFHLLGESMRKWVLSVALCAAWLGAFAAEQKPPVLSLDDPYSQKWALLDNPMRLRVWARQQFSTIDPKKDPVHWAIAVATYIRTQDTLSIMGETRELFDQAMEISRRENVPADALFTLRATEIDMRISETYGIGSVWPPDVVDQQLREKIQLADQLQLPGKKVYFTLHWGLFMLESGREGEGIKKIHEAMRGASSNPGSDLEMMQAKETYAASLDTFGSRSKSKVIYRELEDFCKTHQLRSFCLVIDYDYALGVDSEDKEGNLESSKLLKAALAKAEELNDTSFIGNISASLMAVLDNVGAYEEARVHGERALKIFQEINSGVYVADTQMNLARVLIHLKKPEEALELLKKANQTFPSDYYTDQADIASLMAKAYKMLGQPQKAFEYQQVWARALKENASRNQSAEIAKNLTQINIELEEEQSRSLTQAEDIQKSQDALNQANRLEQQNTLRMLNTIWVVSGLMIVTGIMGLIWLRQQNRRIIRLNRHLREDILQRFLPPVIADKVAKGQAVLDEIPHEEHVTALFGRLVDWSMRLRIWGRG